jgi:hypothetical protein
MQQRKKRRGLLGTLLLTAILVTAVFAYTSTISGLNPPAVGASTSVVDGFAASNIHWVSTAGKTVDGLTFTLAPAPNIVRVNVDGTWQNCSAVSTAVTCNFVPGIDAETITNLDVYAAQ